MRGAGPRVPRATDKRLGLQGRRRGGIGGVRGGAERCAHGQDLRIPRCVQAITLIPGRGPAPRIQAHLRATTGASGTETENPWRRTLKAPPPTQDGSWGLPLVIKSSGLRSTILPGPCVKTPSRSHPSSVRLTVNSVTLAPTARSSFLT